MKKAMEIFFSPASGGAIYVRDPYRLVGEDQLNGGRFAPLTPADWELILPYLRENERLFGIPVFVYDCFAVHLKHR